MFAAAFMSLALASQDRSPAALEAIQGTWHGDNEATVVIHGSYLTLTSDDGYTQFTMRLIFRPGRLRFQDEYATIELPYRLEGGRLRIGDIEYQRRIWRRAR